MKSKEPKVTELSQCSAVLEPVHFGLTENAVIENAEQAKIQW